MHSASRWRGMAARHRAAGSRRKRAAIAAGAAALASAGLATALAGQPAHAATARQAPASAASSWRATVVTTGNGVMVRTAPRISATAVGETYRGQRYRAEMPDVAGGQNRACGAGYNYNMWTRILFRGHWRYSAGACYSLRIP